MRTHSRDGEGGRELRPKAARLDQEDLGLTYHAAAAGRTDVLGPAGLLGLQRAVGNAGVGALLADQERAPVLDVVNSGGGSPLDAATRVDMESRLGHDFGDVRVHTDDRFEREAAANAERAIAAPATSARVSPAGPAVQRQEAAPDEQEEEPPTAQGSFVQRQQGEVEEEAPAE